MDTNTKLDDDLALAIEISLSYGDALLKVVLYKKNENFYALTLSKTIVIKINIMKS